MTESLFEFNKIYTLSEATSKYSDLDLMGHRYSASNINLERSSWTNLLFTNFEYSSNNNNTDFFILKSDFYTIGFDLSVVANTINDFQFKAGIFLVRDGKESLLCEQYIRTLFENKKQNISILEQVNLTAGDRLRLKIYYSKGLVFLNYGALFAFINGPNNHDCNLLHESNLQHYYKLDESRLTTLLNDSIGDSHLSLSVPFTYSAGNGTGILFRNDTNTYLYSDSLNITENNNSFTLSLWLKIDELFNRGRVPGYIYLFSQYYTDTSLHKNLIFSLYLDTWTYQFVFEFLDSNNSYKNIRSRPYPEILFDGNGQKYEFISLSYDNFTNNLKLYFNSILSQSLKISGFKTYYDISRFIFGNYYNNLGPNICNSSFYLADISIFNRALSQYELELIYKNSDLLTKNNPIYIQNLYHDSSNSSVSLPISASSVDYLDGNGVLSTVQDKLLALSSQVNNISSSNVSTYNGSIVLSDWVLDANKSAYIKTLPSSIHNILNPWEVIVQISYNGLYIVGESLCEIEIDAITNNIYFYVNDVPDGRFVGRFIIIGY